ncbi:MAG: formylglycine-generating enzyme family protein [Muribaculaceae bacterium]|nr:formylglycine-generating enzyme family protein [Muribaculaceae bacterium]
MATTPVNPQDVKGKTAKGFDQPASFDASAQPVQSAKHIKNDAKASIKEDDGNQKAPRLNANSQNITVNGVSFAMVKVEGGTFTMGATAEQGSETYSSEKPAHQVTISTFSIGATEVTQELWQAVMGYNPSLFYGNNKRPVDCVSWDDCQAFIYKLNQLTGKRFRLPTEAEWEYAARGGKNSNGYKYSGSNNINSVSWYYDNSDNTTHPVATKVANELGIYDMSGNVSEWCQDFYQSYNDFADGVVDPWGISDGYSIYKCLRGGNAFCISNMSRVSSRYWIVPEYRNNYNSLNGGFLTDTNYPIGMRLVLTENDKPNISFVKSEQQVTINDENTVIPVVLKRGNTNGTYKATIILETEQTDNFTLQSDKVNFADGEKEATAYVLVKNMVFGETYQCTLTLSDADKATTNHEYGDQIVSTTVSITRNYMWTELNPCTFTDYTWENGDPVSGQVRVMRAEGTNMYKLIAPLATVFRGIESGGDNSDFEFTLDADKNMSFPDGTYLDYWGYKMYYNASTYPDYCYITRTGDSYEVNFLLLAGTSLFTGGKFEITLNWGEAAPAITTATNLPAIKAEATKKVFVPLQNLNK